MTKSYIPAGVTGIVLGLMMLFAPSSFIRVVVVVLGAGSVASGVLGLCSGRTLLDDVYFKRSVLIRSVVCIAIGALAVLLPLVFAGIVWTVMAYVLAAGLLASAALEIYGAVKLRAEAVPAKPYYMEIAVSVIFAVILFTLPAAVGITIVRIIGLALLAVSAGLTVWAAKSAEPEYVRNVTPDFEETGSAGAAAADSGASAGAAASADTAAGAAADAGGTAENDN